MFPRTTMATSVSIATITDDITISAQIADERAPSKCVHPAKSVDGETTSILPWKTRLIVNVSGYDTARQLNL